ncbi:putative endo-xylogalacturonan hydrolase A [Rosellinia necatrix]|uniref:Putative endo-xylogalacturonan hydrolase A n=1 Tax=Rosellinia necatrix TaxID=77044 RepID=A0A1S8A4P0_ROSNE|nr:putative endo-xylogalacturonan hydrolase A [Rosellinia necatrix]
MHLVNNLLLLAGITNAVTLPPTRVIERAATCTPQAGGSSSIDDVPAIQSAIAACPSGTIVIPPSSTYYINSVFSFKGCAGCTLQIEGLLKVASNTDYWNGRAAIFDMSGITGAKVYSSTGTGVIDGNGQEAWDRFARDSSYDRPTLFWINGSRDVIVQNLRFKDAPNVFHSARGDSSNVRYIDIDLSAVSRSGNLPKNTDGWDIGPASHVSIAGATVANDDDCVAFKPGASDVTVTDITCAGSHGLSVGSLGAKAGATDTVQNIRVSRATMTGSTKAAGIKLYPGGASHGAAVVRNVTWEDIVVDDTEYAFQIQSCYNEDASYCQAAPSAAQLSEIVVRRVSGTTSSKYSPTIMNLNCPAGGTCGVTMSSITVKPPSGSARILCANTPADLGVTCSSGASG